MSPTPSRSIKVQYWLKRLDHAIDHIQSSSKLIYLVDGAVLAAVYFFLGTVGLSRQAIFFASFIFLLLAVINYLHSEVIRHRNQEYINISNRLLAILGERSEHKWPTGHFVIKRDLYRLIHIVISVALLLIFLAALLYGSGCFETFMASPQKHM
jgi:hypothetical protein